MNISYKWLNDLIEIDLSPNELAQKLTNVGLTVEGVQTHGDDYVFDIDLTSNRPDCLSHLGVAREVAVITDQRLTSRKAAEDCDQKIPMPAVLAGDVVRIQNAKDCHRFTARIIRNVKIGPSPEWLASRLETIGERSINNVADITNYVMQELGQPMHAFDLDRLAGNRIVVRAARDGESITTLDEAERKLDSSMLAICDAEKPVAVAGVMGGLDSSITNSTVNVLLEVAHFRRENIRATTRKLNLHTEASYRFERGVDIENLIAASNRAARLLCELAAGEMGELIDIYPAKFASAPVQSIDISAAVKRLTGLEVKTAECIRILSSLGIGPVGASQISNLKSEISDLTSTVFSVPTWRHDLSIEEDLVEEIARHIGYDNIADFQPPAFGAGEYQPTESREKLLRQTLVDAGFDEAMSYSFIDTRHDGVFETVPDLVSREVEEDYVTLRDSVIEGAVRMRPSMIPGLLDAVRLNLNHQRRNLKLFEIGKVFASERSETGLPSEQKLLSLVVTGAETVEHRAALARALDFYDAKGAVEAALTAVGVSDADFTAADVQHLRRGQSASIAVNGKQIGHVGRLSDAVAAEYKFKQPVFVAEINLQSVLAMNSDLSAYRGLAHYPSVSRDVTFLVRRDTEFAAIRDTILKANSPICRNVMFVDIYEGKDVPEDQRSMTIRLEYRHDERTLIDAEVDEQQQQILDVLAERLEIGLRTNPSSFT